MDGRGSIDEFGIECLCFCLGETGQPDVGDVDDDVESFLGFGDSTEVAQVVEEDVDFVPERLVGAEILTCGWLGRVSHDCGVLSGLCDDMW